MISAFRASAGGAEEDIEAISFIADFSLKKRWKEKKNQSLRHVTLRTIEMRAVFQ